MLKITKLFLIAFLLVRCYAAPLSPQARQKLRGMLEQAVEQHETAGGVLLILHQGEVVFREAFGYADLESKRPFRVDDRCFIASLTKPISSTLMVMLDERGVLSLDDPVEKWLPEFKGITVQGKGPASSPPLIWQLLSHRSGLPGSEDPGALKMPHGPRSALAGIVANWAKAGLLAQPGARFAYGNAGYMTASRIVEVATGRAYEAVLKESLLQPLGMSRTTFRPSAADLAAMPRRYLRTKEGLKPDTRTYIAPEGDALVNPAGGLFSTADDLGKFLRLHLDGGMAGGKRLVSRESLARMYRPQPITGWAGTRSAPAVCVIWAPAGLSFGSTSSTIQRACS
jgi:CubicO group peptidase (beta-lactamase class C family)